MTRWDLSESYGLVEKAFGRDQLALTRPCFSSIVDRQHFADYHYKESLRLANTFKRNYLASNRLFDLHRGDNAKMRDAFEICMIKTGAHVTACVSSIHAIPDIVANGVYFAVGLNLSTCPLDDHRVSIANVLAIPKLDERMPDITTLLRKLTAGSAYSHISALSNLGKHRSIVRAGLNEDCTGDRQELHELHFAFFQRGKTQFPGVSVSSLVKPEYERMFGVVVEIGHALNTFLRTIPPLKMAKH